MAAQACGGTTLVVSQRSRAVPRSSIPQADASLDPSALRRCQAVAATHAAMGVVETRPGSNVS